MFCFPDQVIVDANRPHVVDPYIMRTPHDQSGTRPTSCLRRNNQTRYPPPRRNYVMDISEPTSRFSRSATTLEHLQKQRCPMICSPHCSPFFVYSVRRNIKAARRSRVTLKASNLCCCDLKIIMKKKYFITSA